MLTSITRQRYATILILVVFSVVITLFSVFHSINVLNGNGTSHQADAFSCLFTICVAIFTVPELFTLLMLTTTVFYFFPFPQSEPLFLLEKPPRE
jgi:hypothetical protein